MIKMDFKLVWIDPARFLRKKHVKDLLNGVQIKSVLTFTLKMTLRCVRI